MNEISIVAGGYDDFMTVRHMVLRGSQEQIGRALAEEARTSADWLPAATDPLINQARSTWFERNWPQHHARLAGVAAAFGIDPGDDRFRLDDIPALPAGSACSAVWCPPAHATDGRGRIARNYDFFTLSAPDLMASLTGAQPMGTGVPMAARPCVITTIPDDGPASTVLTMSDLDGCTEGINESGLTVVLLLGDVAATEPPSGPPVPQAGLNVTQLPRFLLDTCQNVEQAKRALLGAKQYSEGAPCHYLIADASGQSFVWERGAQDSEHIIEAAAGPLCATNHPLHRHPDVTRLPEDTPESFHTYERARTLAKRTAGPLSADGLRQALDAVSMPAVPEEPWRTLWRSVFDPARRTMNVRFHLGDGPHGTARHSPEISFGVGT
ncbi:C45 family peptidase [Streptosporangium roseum]|uniref:C45 family peptidase n=1 Tax=Streptosporangium roseum TaxID=2001 RepID=UPI003323B7E2